MKISYKATDIKTVWCWQKNKVIELRQTNGRHTNYQNSPHINEENTYCSEDDSEKLAHSTEKNKVRFLLNVTSKNRL